MTPKSITLTISASDLRDLVSPVMPLAMADDTFPALSTVTLRSVGKYVTATATDRYRAGVRRMAMAAPAGLDAMVPVPALKQMLRVFRATRSANPELTMEFTDEAVKVSAGGFSDLLAASMSWGLRQGDSVVPSINKVFAKFLDAEPSADPVGINPSLMADFRHAQRRGEGMKVTCHGPRGPVMVRVGDDFLGLLQPMRIDEGEAAGGWAEVVAAEPAKKTAGRAA